MLVHSMRAAEIARSEGAGREAAVGEIGGIAGCDESVGLAQTFRHGAQHSGAVGDQATDQRGILGGLEGWPVGLPGHPRRVITQPAIKPGCVMDLGLDLVGINGRIPVSGGSVSPAVLWASCTENGITVAALSRMQERAPFEGVARVRTSVTGSPQSSCFVHARLAAGARF